MSDRIFGHIENVIVGDVFSTRIELARAKVHRPLQAGISGSSKIGADSIVLSHGYEDDEDNEVEIIYTGEGGRDPNSGKQVSDQFLTGRNLALVKSKENGLPVRVIRKVDSGYRYDGLFRVTDSWKEVGRSGFIIWRFRLEKLIDYPISEGSQINEPEKEYSKTKRVQSNVIRIVRDTEISKKVKELYDFKCQVCGIRLESATGPYAEAAHIKPLGKPHNGPDSIDNLICLCPNHHVLFDRGGFTIRNNFELIGIQGFLNIHPKHRINKVFLEYHRDHYFIEKDKNKST